MAKKTIQSTPEETPIEKQTIEEVVAEAHAAEEEFNKKAEEEANKPEEVKPEVNLEEELEKNKKEVAEQITKDVVEPIKQELEELRKTIQPEQKDDYDKFVEEYTEKNGSAPEWKQVAIFLEQRAVSKIKEEQAAEVDRKAVEEQEAKKVEEERATENFKVWQGQLEEIESKGLIPKMEKPEAGDAGFDARVQLYGMMSSTWNKPGISPVTNLWEVVAKNGNQVKTSSQPAGADAPVSLGSSNGSGGDEKGYSYDEVHNGSRDLEGFLISEMNKKQ